MYIYIIMYMLIYQYLLYLDNVRALFEDLLCFRHMLWASGPNALPVPFRPQLLLSLLQQLHAQPVTAPCHRWAIDGLVLKSFYLLVQCGSIAGGGTPAALTALQSAKGLSEASLAWILPWCCQVQNWFAGLLKSFKIGETISCLWRNGFARILIKLAANTELSSEGGTNSLPKIFRDPEYVLPLPVGKSAVASGQTMASYGKFNSS